jgi:hypothetical protein
MVARWPFIRQNIEIKISLPLYKMSTWLLGRHFLLDKNQSNTCRSPIRTFIHLLGFIINNHAIVIGIIYTHCVLGWVGRSWGTKPRISRTKTGHLKYINYLAIKYFHWLWIARNTTCIYYDDDTYRLTLHMWSTADIWCLWTCWVQILQQ